MTGRKESFFIGFKEGIPIAVGYIPIGITFGLVAKAAGVSSYISIMMSLLVYAGASQFAAVNLLTLGAGCWEIILTTFIINFRYLLLTASVSRLLEANVSKKLRGLIAFGITDETFSLISLSPEEKLDSDFMLGVNFIAYISWFLGTAAGVFLGAGLPDIIQHSMGVALYAMLIGLLVPTIKESYPTLVVALLAIGFNTVLRWGAVFEFISSGWKIIIATVLAAVIGALVFSEEVDE